MYSELTQDVLFVTAIIVFVIFIIVFSLVVRNFDHRFDVFLKTAAKNIATINMQLVTLHDVLLLMSTLLKPSCVEALRKRLIHPDSALLKDIYACSQIESECQGTVCCCNCKHQRVLYAMTAEEELKNVAVMCSVGGLDTIASEHGECLLYEQKTNDTDEQEK